MQNFHILQIATKFYKNGAMANAKKRKHGG